MQVETLGEALAAGWRVHARCLEGTVEYTRSMAKCRHQAELSLETLVWTRGRNISLSGLRERMMCPRCGNRRVVRAVVTDYFPMVAAEHQCPYARICLDSGWRCRPLQTSGSPARACGNGALSPQLPRAAGGRESAIAAAKS
jgi:DNA-directed RNA polymerase subunit RPC12/RpoP